MLFCLPWPRGCLLNNRDVDSGGMIEGLEVVSHCKEIDNKPKCGLLEYPENNHVKIALRTLTPYWFFVYAAEKVGMITLSLMCRGSEQFELALLVVEPIPYCSKIR